MINNIFKKRGSPNLLRNLQYPRTERAVDSKSLVTSVPLGTESKLKKKPKTNTIKKKIPEESDIFVIFLATTGIRTDLPT